MIALTRNVHNLERVFEFMAWHGTSELNSDTTQAMAYSRKPLQPLTSKLFYVIPLAQQLVTTVANSFPSLSYYVGSVHPLAPRLIPSQVHDAPHSS
jgi:hypothetical protein